MRSQLKAVTKIAIAHDPMPQASPTTTTIMAFPVSFGLSSTVRKRSRAPMPKMTNASVWLSHQFSDDRPDHTKEDERLTFLEIGQRIHERRTAWMPRDDPGTAHGQSETEKESQEEFWMGELLDTVLDRQP